MDHRIDVVYVPSRITVALAAPSTPMNSGDTVTWTLPPQLPGLEIRFTKVGDSTQDVATFEDTRPNGPFLSLTHGGDRIIGVIANFDQTPLDSSPLTYRFLYKIMSNGIPLKWASADGTNGGSVDIPSNPPTR